MSVCLSVGEGVVGGRSGARICECVSVCARLCTHGCVSVCVCRGRGIVLSVCVRPCVRAWLGGRVLAFSVYSMQK